MTTAMMFLAAAPVLMAGAPRKTVFDAQAVKSVHVAIQRGRLTVVASEDGQVSVDVKKRANERLCRVEVRLKGADVLILARTEGALNGAGTISAKGSAIGPLQVPANAREACEVDVRVTAPPSVALHAAVAHVDARVLGRIGPTYMAVIFSELHLAAFHGPLALTASKSRVGGSLATRQVDISAHDGSIDLGWTKLAGDARVSIASLRSAVRLLFPKEIEVTVDRTGMMSGFRREHSAAPACGAASRTSACPYGRVTVELSGIGGTVSLGTTKS